MGVTGTKLDNAAEGGGGRAGGAEGAVREGGGHGAGGGERDQGFLYHPPGGGLYPPVARKAAGGEKTDPLIDPFVACVFWPPEAGNLSAGARRGKFDSPVARKAAGC